MMSVRARTCLFLGVSMIVLAPWLNDSALPSDARYASNSLIMILDAKAGRVIDRPTSRCSPSRSVADGRGGWYFGGNSPIRGNSQACLVHLRSDGSLDPLFKPRLSQYQFPSSIVFQREMLFVADKDGVSALDTRSGARLWRTVAHDYVSTLVYERGKLYAGGGFKRIGGVARDAVAELNPKNGKPTSWKVRIARKDYPVSVEITSANGNIYIGGLFDKINGKERPNGFAAVTADGARLTPWAPREKRFPPVEEILATHGEVIVAGYHGGFSVYDARTGKKVPWRRRVGGDASVFAISGNTLYLGAATYYTGFDRAGGKPANNLAAVRLPEGTFLDWKPNLGPCVSVGSISVSRDKVLIGGEFGKTSPGCPAIPS